MIEYSYQKVFHQYTKTLEQRLLGQICLDNDVDVSTFLAWVSADKVRKAKLNEITETRIATMESHKK